MNAIMNIKGCTCFENVADIKISESKVTVDQILKVFDNRVHPKTPPWWVKFNKQK